MNRHSSIIIYNYVQSIKGYLINNNQKILIIFIILNMIIFINMYFKRIVIYINSLYFIITKKTIVLIIQLSI